MGKFGELAARYRALAETPALVVAEAKDQIEGLVRDEFKSGNDPYGRQWLKKKNGQASTLTESGTLAASLAVTATGTTIEISFSDYKFAFHQRTRPMLSVGVMPTTWSRAIEDAFAKAVK